MGNGTLLSTLLCLLPVAGGPDRGPNKSGGGCPAWDLRVGDALNGKGPEECLDRVLSVVKGVQGNFSGS